MLEVQEPDEFVLRDRGQDISPCSEALASRIIRDWDLPVSTAELAELPAGTAIARLPGMIVTSKVDNDGTNLGAEERNHCI